MASSRTGPQNVPGRRRFRIVSNHILSAKGVAAGVADRQYLPAPEVAPEGEDEDTRTEANLRTELAAAFRFFARERMNEGVANHFSVMVDDTHFLCNPFGSHFANLKASELVLLDATETDEAVVHRKRADGKAPLVDPTAYYIHGAVHRLMGKRARCVMHLHPHYATALTCLQDMRLPPVDQNSARFYNRLSLDTDYGGLALGSEAERMVKMIGSNKAMLMGSHGCIVIGETVGQCIDLMYYLELSCRAYMTALQAGKPLNVLSDDVAELAAKQWDETTELYGDQFMSEVLKLCDEECPNFRD